MMTGQFLRMSILIAFLIMPASAGLARAQDADLGARSAYASGLEQPATHFDIEGNPILEIQVTNVEQNWQGFGEYEAPESGQMYVKVDVSITNLTGEAKEVLPSLFSVHDSMGNFGELSSFYEVEGVWENTDDVSVGAGETHAGSLVFAMGAEDDVTWLTYFPSSPQVLIYLGEPGSAGAFAVGADQPATVFGQDRSPLFEMQVMGIEYDWQEYESREPQPGKMYVKVDLKFTNPTEQPVDAMPYSIGVRDAMGIGSPIVNINTDYWSVDPVTIEPGASIEGSMIFMMNIDSEVTFVTYASFPRAVIYLGE